MYASGERAAAMVIRFGRRLAGDRGEFAVRLAGQAIRSVALGVVVTAVAQAAGRHRFGRRGGSLRLPADGADVHPVPRRIGPGLVPIPAVVWMYYAAMRWGDGAARVHHRCRHDGPFPASGSDPQGRRSAVAAYPRRRHRRAPRDRSSGYFHRTHGYWRSATRCSMPGWTRPARLSRIAAPMTPMGGISRARSPCRTAA